MTRHDRTPFEPEWYQKMNAQRADIDEYNARASRRFVRDLVATLGIALALLCISALVIWVVKQ